MILPKIRVLRSHGRQAIEDLDAVQLTEEFRGRPELTFTEDTTEAEHAQAICPTGAFTADPLTLDLGRCLFCGACARVAFDPEQVRPEIRRCFGRALQLREVSAGGDASVEMELNATGNVNFDLGRFGIGFTASPRHADGVVVSGPITANMAEALEICYDAVAEPKILVMCGTEACSGGLFAESRALDRSFLDSHKPDLWLPGAPTHPMIYIDGLRTLLGHKKRL